MQKYLLIGLLAFNISTSQASDKKLEVNVTRILDGDTLEVVFPNYPDFLHKPKIRIYGVDTPETHSKCDFEKSLGFKAKEFTENFIKETDNKIFIDDVKEDKYGGRFVAKVSNLKNEYLSELLIKNGLAKEYFGNKKEPWCK